MQKIGNSYNCKKKEMGDIFLKKNKNKESEQSLTRTQEFKIATLTIYYLSFMGCQFACEFDFLNKYCHVNT